MGCIFPPLLPQTSLGYSSQPADIEARETDLGSPSIEVTCYTATTDRGWRLANEGPGLPPVVAVFPELSDVRSRLSCPWLLSHWGSRAEQTFSPERVLSSLFGAPFAGRNQPPLLSTSWSSLPKSGLSQTNLAFCICTLVWGELHCPLSVFSPLP